MTTFAEWTSAGTRTAVPLATGRFDIFHRTGGAGPWCTLLHGFPTSSYDWHRVWDGLAARRHVLTFDFLGFGDSDKPAEHDYRILEQADVVEALWRLHGITSTDLVAHDYGVSVAQELLARRAEDRLGVQLGRVVFLNGGLYPELHRPQPAQVLLLDPVQGPALAQHASEELFAGALAATFSPTHQPSADELHEHWLAISRRDGHRLGPRIIQYIPERGRHRDRWVGALEGADVPRGFVWGDLDPVSGAHMADRIAERLPRAPLLRLDDVGHWPQLEAPDRVGAAIARQLG